ncbi:MAG: metallophosphoesterase [Gemmatimonadaceae bacterium]
MTGASLPRWLRIQPLFVQPSPPGPPVLVGAGDIAGCPDQYKDEATKALLDGIAGTVFTAGDNAYMNGTPAEFAACYGPSWTWGQHKDRTRPAAGNHEYISLGSGYFTYFGPVSNPPFGYYSYNLGAWHVVVINSTPQVYMCYPPELKEGTDEAEEQVPYQDLWGDPQLDELPNSPTAGRACAGDAAQQAWLIADLIAHRRYKCTVTYFHHPRFSSGRHGNHYQMQRIWDILYAFGVDVVISGHDHVYERFAPQDPEGRRNFGRGIRQFTVGTGGAPLYDWGVIQPNSEVRNNTTHGVLKLNLGNRSYAWEFVPVAGATFTDSGSGRCH